MDPLAVVLRRTGLVSVVGAGDPQPDGPAWVAAIEADLADRGWVMRGDLRTAAAALPPTIRVRWADWLLATVDELVGADRTMLPLYRAFPDTPRDIEVDPPLSVSGGSRCGATHSAQVRAFAHADVEAQ
ncbi:hypothetical protein, partial [Asanoa sp. NPDC050611]|uniref:hypothetical protein n=1 Tax=Asanoa sp. NPDC050611 TaxID=3157098 RepID=UPI0033DD58E8